MKFLQDYATLSKNTEIPRIFTFWCGVAGISAALGRRVWIDMGHWSIYPNFYILLVASSGKCRKSTAIGIIENLLRSLEPPINIIAQKITPEALFTGLPTKSSNPRRLLEKLSEGIIIADEMATLINRKSLESGLDAMLISLFDCKDVFEYRTRGRGLERLDNTCLSLLCGSTVNKIKDAFPPSAIGSGLTSRFIFVGADRVKKPVSDPRLSEDMRNLGENVLRQLQAMTLIEGRMVFTKKSFKLQDEIYQKYWYHNKFDLNPDLSGYASRRHNYILKLAMIFSIAESNELKMKAKHLKWAEAILKETEEKMPEILIQISASEKGSIQMRIQNLIVLSGKEGIDYHKLLGKVMHQVSTVEFQGIMATLTQSKRVKMVAQGTRIFYVSSNPRSTS